jgi:hypothetical protein
MGQLRTTPGPRKRVSGALVVSLEACLDPALAPEKIIDACTGVIRSGQFWGPDIASLHNRRAIAYFAMRDYAKALSDLDTAILRDRFNETYGENRKIVAGAAGR